MVITDAVRKALEVRYTGVCTITERQEQTDPKTHITRLVEVDIRTGQPCRLSYASAPPTSGAPVAEQAQTVKLFLSPEIVVRPGSRITVTQEGRTVAYACSGVPARYASHQEISLTLFERWP